MAAPAPPTVAWNESEESVPPYSLAPPEEVTQAEIKAWERPWTVQEMRTEANYWSLAGDAGLLHHLQEFSQRLISQTHEIGQEMDGLVHEAKLTSVRMNNVINNFIMLANTQFVENRVYDEDVSQASKEEKKAEQQEKTREQREAELIPRVISALKLGIDVIDQAFERIEIPVAAESDSEDEEESSANKGDPVLEEKDPYMNRSLPFLIGSPQFMEDENVGLVEVMSEDEAESDHDNVSDDEGETDESETEYSTSGESEVEGTQRKPRAQTELSTNEDDDSDEEMFSAKKTKKITDSDAESGDISASDDEHNEEKATKHTSGGPTDLTSELAARLGLAAPKRQSEGELFGDGEEEEDESGVESVKQKSKENLPTNKEKHKKDTKKKKEKENAEDKGKTKRKHSKLGDKDDDLFGGQEEQDDDDFFGKSKGGLFSKSKGIFDDDEDADEGNLFDDEEKPAEKIPSKKATEKDNSMFDDEKEDDAVKDKKETVKKTEDTRPRSKSGKILPKNAIPVFGGGEDSKKSGLFEDHEEDDDFFGGASEKTKPAKKEKTEVTKTSRADSIKKSDLFDDGGSDDEDLFGSLAATKRPHKNSIGLTVEGYEEAKVGEENKLEEEKLRKKLEPERKLPPGAVSMFGSGPNPFVAALKKQQEMAEEEDGDSLSDDNTNRRSSFLSSTSPGASAALKTAEKTKKADSISSHDGIGFAEDKEEDADDFFFASKPTSNSKPSDKTSKTQSGGHVGGPVPQADSKKVGSAKPAKYSLFGNADNDDDNDDDFFAVTAKPVERAKPAVVPVVSGADEVKGKKETINTSKPVAQVANKKTAAASLFDDEEEEESAEPLFSNKSPQLLIKSNGNNSKARSLFDDEDALFRPEQDEIPSVDLFSNQGPLSKPSQKKDIHATDTPKRDTPQKNTSKGDTPEKDTPNRSTPAPASKKVAAASKPAASTLFGGGGSDKDDDDLFSSGHIAKPLPTASAEPTFLTDNTEDKSTMEAKEEDVKHEVKKPKKPIGAVSMFGGLDPSALLKGRRTVSISEEDKDKDLKDEKEEKKGDEEAKIKEERPPEAAAPVSKVKLASDLFVDDSDDLFSTEADAKGAVDEVKTDETSDTHTEEIITPKPELAKPKKPAGAVSMFGGLDPSAFLKKRKVEDPEEEEGEKTDPVKLDPEKLAPPETAPKPKVSTRDRHDSNTKPSSLLFGAADDNDDEDLFATTKKKVPPPTAPKSPMLSPRSPLPMPTEASRPEGEPQSPEPPRGKKLAGAVSMFGGLDPFTGFKKKSVSVDEEEKEPSPPREEHLKSPTINVDGSQSLSGLQRSDSVDFDQPAETDTLSSAIKDRPKLNRRRPQSRKARMLAATSTGISFEDTTPTSPTTPTIPEIPDVQDPPLFDPTTLPKTASNELSDKNKIPDSGVDKSKLKTADLFGNDDLIEGPPLSIGKPLAGEDKKDNSVFGKGLFGGKGASSSSTAGKDLFSDSKKSGVTSAEKSKSSSSTFIVLSKADKIDGVDDLFSKPTAKSKTDNVTNVLDKDDKDSPGPDGTGQKAKAGASLEDDEIFAPSSVKSSSGKGSKSKPAAHVVKKSDSPSAPNSSSIGTDTETKSKVPAASLEDDDIFADSGLDKSKADAKKISGTLTAVAKKNDVGEGKNADDSKTVRQKKAVTKVDTLLSDTTDIFSDIPDPAPKEPKKKTTKKIVEKKAVFKDDVDDIFAETSAAVVKPKRDVKKKVTKSAAVDPDNIFDDPLS